MTYMKKNNSKTINSENKMLKTEVEVKDCLYLHNSAKK